MKSVRLVAVSLIAGLSVAAAGWSLYNASRPIAPTVPERPEARSAPKETIPATMEIKPADLARAGEERRDNGLGLRLCWCPPGTFRMGSPRDGPHRDLNEGPAIVTLTRGFWMGKYEVTQSQWRDVMGLTVREQRARDPLQPRPMGDGSTREHVGEGPDHPIYFVSYGDAQEFCRKLTDREREAGRLAAGWEYRLPTEAQWEFACRAGTMTTYSTGDTLSGTQANFDSTKLPKALQGPYHRETTPGDRYPANAWGIHDMHGNVWEWCADNFVETLPGGTDPLVSAGPPSRVYRGGCWHNPTWPCRSATRTGMPPENRGSGLGFRVALVETGPR
jgi:formylglycine-generating enzyme